MLNLDLVCFIPPTVPGRSHWFDPRTWILYCSVHDGTHNNIDIIKIYIPSHHTIPSFSPQKLNNIKKLQTFKDSGQHG